MSKKDLSVDIERNIIKMLHLVAKNGGYLLSELKSMYISEFYEYYRLVSDDLKNK